MNKLKRLSWKFYVGLLLIMLSVSFYLLEYFLFKDAHHIFVFLIEDIAFLFIEVLLVSLIIHRVLESKEKKERMEKLNMVIGVFYSEVGTEFLQMLSSTDEEIGKIQPQLSVTDHSSKEEFDKICGVLESHKSKFSYEKVDWEKLNLFLEEKRNLLLRFLENPNLMEHESFTDLLWSSFHLAEELRCRDSLMDLPKEDYQHLTGDLDRAYSEIKLQWIQHMNHLRKSYPYLFSLSYRKNPFDLDSSPVIKS